MIFLPLFFSFWVPLITEKKPTTSFIQYSKIIDSCRNMEFGKDYRDKKLITISPGGYKGFYTHGVCLYIKENYNLTDYIFSGASAGSWNALFMTCKKDITLSSKYIVETITNSSPNIFELQQGFKHSILEHYTTKDFHLDKLFIGVTVWNHFLPQKFVYSQFCDLEDAIDCCLASSHIPFITGKMMNTYKKLFSFDGGFSSNPYLDGVKSDFHITSNAWDMNYNNNPYTLENWMNLISKGKHDGNKLLQDGYKDAHNHKSYLDSIFLSK